MIQISKEFNNINSVSDILIRNMINIKDSNVLYSFDPPISTIEMAKSIKKELYQLQKGKPPTLQIKPNDDEDHLIKFKSAVSNLRKDFIYKIIDSRNVYHPKCIKNNNIHFIYIILISWLAIWYSYYVSNKTIYVIVLGITSLMILILFYTHLII